MAELVGGALLSGFISVLFKRMASKEVLNFFLGKKAIPKLLNELKIRLISANKLLNDAEEKMLRDQYVYEWLEELKDVIYEADHVMDKINTEALRCEIEEEREEEKQVTKCLSCVPVQLSSLFDTAVKDKLKEILGNLKLLLEQSTCLGLEKVSQRSASIERPLAPLVEESDIYGREDEKKSLVELLLSDDDNSPKISVIPIVGMGGIGKTTLAQVVYYDARVQGHFELKTWVTVSEEFDVPKLTKLIFESITKKKCEFEEDPHGLQSELKAALRGKKFLFVHDDVWNEKYELWDLLKSSFESAARGSKIIVTTRSEIVASQMGNVEPYRLRGISKDDCWELFAKHVFDNVDSDVQTDLKNIGVGIVEKCKGLPLAVKSIAGVLRCMERSPEAWRRILNSDIWELELREVNNTQILPALWLSYSLLPPHLKRCFAFLSVFPKEYRFSEGDREKIIWMWMAEGLLQPQNEKRPEDIGEEYLTTLISRSFFQWSYRYPSKHKDFIIMHDLVHDLALLVSGGLRSTSSSKPRHFSFQESDGGLIELENLSVGVAGLRGLFAQTEQYYWLNSTSTPTSTSTQTIMNKVLVGLEGGGGCLRVLSLLTCSITELPRSAISGLNHLRYLDLSQTYINSLPPSLCTLYNLQTLLLYNCPYLKQLPTDLSRLIRLRNLNIKGTPLNDMPPEMCNMKDLQVLSDYVLGENDGSRIKDLGELRHLRGSFRVKGLHNVTTVADVSGAKMKNKRFLDKLWLEWECEDEHPEKSKKKATEVLNALEPHSGLREIRICGFGGLELASWLTQRSFTEMVKVSLSDCKRIRFLPPFGQLPSLKELFIQDMDGVESIGDEFCATSGPGWSAFPALEILRICGMPLWEKWSFSGVGGQEIIAPIFPRLKEFSLGECEKLSTGLPVGRFPSLASIDICECNSMASVFPGTNNSQLAVNPLYPALASMKISYCGNAVLFSTPQVEVDTNAQSSSRELFSGLLALKELVVDDCKTLWSKRRSWGLQRLSSLRKLILSWADDCDTFPEEGFQLPITLEYLQIVGLRTIRALNGKALKCLTELQELRIHNCLNLECLPDEGLPLSLTTLRIYDCSARRKRRVGRGTGQDWPKIQHIPNIYINGRRR